MSMLLMVKAMHIKVGNPLRKLVLIKLADNANDQGECWPSYQHIADQCEISRSTVKFHIRALESAGLLRRQFRKDGDLNKSNVFYLSLDGANSEQISGAADNLVGRELPGGGAGAARGGGAGAAPRTSHSLEPVKEPLKDLRRNSKVATPKMSKFKFSPDDMTAAEWMRDRVLLINPSSKQPNLESWANDVRMLREIDGRTLKEIGELFDWANRNDFWCSNILSPKTLRKQWDKLTLQRSRPIGNAMVRGGGQNLTADVEDAFRMIERGEII